MARLSVLAVALVGLLAAQPLPALAQEATPAATAAGLRVVEQQTVALPDVRILSMSPDGRRLLGLDDANHRLCGIALDTAAQACAALDLAAARPIPVEDSVAWSPDGSRVAFTEDGLRRLDEPDIWVFDVASGQLTDLTDDGVSGSLLRPRGEGTAWIDLYPAWSPDGQTIAFARAVRGDDIWTDTGIFRIAAAGGPAELIAPLPAPGAFAVYPELRWSADGRFLVYSLLMPDRDDPASGLWVVGADGKNPRQVVADGVPMRPLLVELSARGTAFVVSGDQLASNPNAPATVGQRFALVDVVSGAVTPFDPTEAPMWGTPRLAMLTFSPDGSKLLYVNLEQPGRTPDRRLLVRDLDRQATTTLLDPIDSWFGGQEPSGLVWGRNDLVFVPGPGGTAILLRLAGA